MAENATEKKETAKNSYEQFLEKLRSGGYTDLQGSFNEQTQSTYQPRMFKRLKFEPQIAQLICVPLLLSIPFDPLTGEMSEDGYNMRRPFRPSTRPDEFLMNMKRMAHENADLKKKLLEYAKYEKAWDTKETKQFTDADRAVLFIYRRPMSTSHASLRINKSEISGEQYKTTLLLNSKQDPLTGEFIGEISKLHQIGLLSGQLAQMERKSFDEAVQKGTGANCLSITLGRPFVQAKTFDTVKEIKSEAAMTIRGQISDSYPTGKVKPVVVTPLIAIPLTPLTGGIYKYGDEDVDSEEPVKGELLSQFVNPVDFQSSLYYTDNFQNQQVIDGVIGNAFPKDPKHVLERNADLDVYPNFVLLEWITTNPATSFDNDIEKMAAARAMALKTQNEAAAFYHRRKKWADPQLETFMNNLAEFYPFIEKDSFNLRMSKLMLANYRTATKSVEERALRVFSELLQMNDQTKDLFNDDIVATHKDLLMEIYPLEFAERADSIMDKLEKGEEEFQKLVSASGDAETLIDDNEDTPFEVDGELVIESV